MAKDTDHLAGSFETENTGGLLSGFLAEEDDFDRRSLWRLGSWGVGAVGAVIVAVLANQSSIGMRREQFAAADLARQAQQIQLVAKESQNETRRLASAIDTLNGDRDRLYSRVTVLEQGLDSVTGAIATAKRRRGRRRKPLPNRLPRRPSRRRRRKARRAARLPPAAPVVAPVMTTVAKSRPKSRRWIRPRRSRPRRRWHPLRQSPKRRIRRRRRRPPRWWQPKSMMAPPDRGGDQTDRTGQAGQSRHRGADAGRRGVSSARRRRRAGCGAAGDAAPPTSPCSAPNLASMSAARIRSAACARCGAGF